MRRTGTVLTCLALAVALGACEGDEEITGTDEAGTLSSRAAAEAASVGSATYEVTITNLTDTQPLTPPLAAVHPASVDLFSVGSRASIPLRQIAENGNLDPMVMRLQRDPLVNDVVVAVSSPAPPLMPGASIGFQVRAQDDARYLTFVSMLICTNDGFTGVDTHELPQTVGESVTLFSDGYDAGSEINTEDFADLVPPCPVLTGVDSDVPGTGTSNPDLFEGGRIRHHPGIQGVADLDPAIHGWADPAAMIEIVRVE